ncbi:site-specific integrase [Runella zeae]|uniref:site-specific integrase n=1 Tax=Runella zeae TaxID=94255 RepID=UPI00040A6C7C|nr:site-specific integrase [Runella zeae]
MATKVTLRQKPISKGRRSLYLDFYPPIPHPESGKPTRREFLGIYIYEKPKNQIEKEHNKQTTLLAEQIKQKRENQLNKPEIYTDYEKQQLKIKELGEQNFVEYFRTLVNKRKESNYDNWVSAYNYLKTFTNGNLKFANLNEKFCNEFKEYLLTTKSNKSSKAPLSQNSAVSYFNKLKAALKQAHKDGYLQNDLNVRIQSVKQAETRREVLTIEELNRLAKTECKNPLLKSAALFSALTGLRHSDVIKLVWGEIEYISNEGYILKITTQKTKSVENIPISEQAYSLLGERKEPTDKVFEGLKYSAYENKHLYQWIEAAGVTKNIKFHCFRHTYAVLQLSKGTQITTLQKLLTHKDLKTTMIYAKVLDQTKRDAADKIKLEF